MAGNQKHEREEESPTPPSQFPFVSNKRAKALTLTSSSPHLEKGKSKIIITEEERDGEDGEEEETDGDADGGGGENGMEMELGTCGICLSDEGKLIRGQINSCDHYFCFVCIMEWSKLESRCPMCKRRFTSILRLPKPGVFACERLLHVPVRDQVYHPLGNGTGPSDPYANARCVECERAEDESLLLLCDLCDSAAHTYCVGLGFTVPEGDWYCRDCDISRSEHSKGEQDIDCSYPNLHRSLDTVPSHETDISISEIVQEEAASCRSIHCKMRRDIEEPHESPGRGPSESYFLPAERSSNAADSGKPEQVARTLHHCRKLHGRIKALRENWNALRKGTVSFSSDLRHSSGVRNAKKPNNRGGIHVKSGEPHSSASPRGEDTISGSVVNTNPYDVERAWEMMNIAKSIKGASNDAGSDQFHKVDNLSIKRNRPKEAEKKNSKFSMRCGKPASGILNCGIKLEKCRRYQSLDFVCKEHKSLGCEKQKIVAESQLGHSCFPATEQQEGCHEIQSSMQEKSSQDGVSYLAIHELSDSENGRDVHNDLGPSTGLLPQKSEVSSRKMKPVVSSSSATDHSGGVAERCRKAKDSQGQNDGQKSEVQSLVKLNLKLLSNDKKLGVDKFKEVARLATHTILAACGLEHSTSCVRPIKALTCMHTSQFPEKNIQQQNARTAGNAIYMTWNSYCKVAWVYGKYVS